MGCSDRCRGNKKSHRCACRLPVNETGANGLVLMSSAPSVQSRLAPLFGNRDGRADLFEVIGDHALDMLREIIAAFSQMERRSIHAAFMDEHGRVDPWSNAPIDKVLGRLDTPWLPDVLNNERLRFDLQPIVDALTLRTYGYEALMRCDGGTIHASPFELIEASKAHDALLKLDQIARRNAIVQCAPKLQDHERLFVNFLPLTVYDPDVCLQTTFKAAEKAGIPFDRLTFEVVESEEFPDIEHLDRILSKYREVGCKVALDDLGAGNTSLTYIDRLNPDYVKIDREIVRNAAISGEQSMLRGLIAHAKDRGIKVLGEGVETMNELDMLREMGTDLIQGYLIAKPSAEPVREYEHSLPRLAA